MRGQCNSIFTCRGIQYDGSVRVQSEKSDLNVFQQRLKFVLISNFGWHLNDNKKASSCAIRIPSDFELLVNPTRTWFWAFKAWFHQEECLQECDVYLWFHHFDGIPSRTEIGFKHVKWRVEIKLSHDSKWLLLWVPSNTTSTPQMTNSKKLFE